MGIKGLSGTGKNLTGEGHQKHAFTNIQKTSQ